jgi:tetrapyrrole methylase family protein/MazG family protein
MSSIQDVIKIIGALRAENGCPWDRQQTPLTLSKYIIEEVYELVEAIVEGDNHAIQEELGDVFFQMLFLVYLLQEDGQLTLDQVLEDNITKMVRRHPHVFGDEEVENADQVKQRWRDIKRLEKPADSSLMDSVPSGMPALMRAYRLSERAAGIGFDWPDLRAVMGQSELEWSEFKSELPEGDEARCGQDSAEALEFGDVLFSLVNVARKAGFHPENALQRANSKFIRRFKAMERMAKRQGQDLAQLSGEEMESLWQRAKAKERGD